MSTGKIIALSGGVGGAKLVLGLSHVVPGHDLIVVTNTGDDFDHLGLRICPDTDTVLYTLGGLADPDKGWGRIDETWTFMASLGALGGPDWFNLGDGDLALHVFRTDRLRAGDTLGKVTADVARNMGIGAAILPMCDQPVATMVDTPQGRLAFQEYFVRDRCAPAVTGFEFSGVAEARPNPAIVDALADQPTAIIIAPSNPYVSVDPILAVPGMRDLLRGCGAPIIAVSPIVGGAAIKGPAAKMMAELGKTASALEIARHYLGFADGFIIDEQDAELASEIEEVGMQVRVLPTIMTNLATRIELAENAVEYANQLSGSVER